jgi:hypothetical protein
MTAGEELTWYYQISAHPEDDEPLSPPPVPTSPISGPISSSLSLSDVADLFPALNAPPSVARSHSALLPLAQVVERIDAEPPSVDLANLFPASNAPPWSSAARSHSALLPLAQVVERIDVDADPTHICVRQTRRRF